MAFLFENSLDAPYTYVQDADILVRNGKFASDPTRFLTAPQRLFVHLRHGSLYRIVEPVLLFFFKRKARLYGYRFSGELAKLAHTDAEIEAAALYRALRQIEKNGFLCSEWDSGHSGPTASCIF